jgi:hypothetical protein
VISYEDADGTRPQTFTDTKKSIQNEVFEERVDCRELHDRHTVFSIKACL